MISAQSIEPVYRGILITCLLLAIAQTAHFYFYFDQPSALSIKWSVKASIIWALLFVLVVQLNQRLGLYRLTGANRLLIWSMVAITCSAMQVFVAVFMDFLLGTASRPLLADFLHLYNKRWLQNLLVFGLFFAWWQHLRSVAQTEQTKPAESETIRLVDDAGTHFVHVDDISHIEALGNYVSVALISHEKPHIIRGTLKGFEKNLESHGFLRISRSALVNTNLVTASAKDVRNQLALVMHGGEQLQIGRTYKSDVKAKLNL